MRLESLTLLDDIVQVKLIGRLDLEGTQAISDRFSFATTARKGKYIVDLSELSFLASIGIRMFMTSAKAQLSRGGKVVLAAPQPETRKVLEASGIDILIELADDVESAIVALKST